MDYYKDILMEERSEYKISAQSYIHIEEKEGYRNKECKTSDNVLQEWQNMWRVYVLNF